MTTADSLLSVAIHHAQAGRFAEMVALCDSILSVESANLSLLLDVGALLLNFGFLSSAQDCFERAKALDPHDLRPLVNLANLAKESARHGDTRRLYSWLLAQYPEQAVIRRNVLISLEYDPGISEQDRLAQAKAWGHWAIQKAGGKKPRPACTALAGRPLRIGYISADFCQHTVGLFVRDILQAHDPRRVQVFAYHAGQVNDWVTDALRQVMEFRDVYRLNDIQLVEQIYADAIDVLIDLSGHTAGSRLTVFAHRPAPVMVSWLGYFATTGLSYIDAVLLDEWHAPEGAEDQFVEPIIRLLCGRFCYQPVPWASAEAVQPPFGRNGHITFGCFNNTAKFNDDVLDVWSKVLGAIPNSRLVLKWRTFNDKAFCQKITDIFANRGIASERIELRGPSFHTDLLKEYADIDIALDPFPFSGGLTSCEALWMGVPVVTWPQNRVVSRQTFAFLSLINLPELIASDADDYVRIAIELANDGSRLMYLRSALRGWMRASPLMDVKGFTHQLESTLIDLYRHIEKEENAKSMNAIGPVN